jgi:hypothetical protein
MIDEVTEVHLAQNLAIKTIMQQSRLEFVKTPKFKIYSRLISEIVNQFCQKDVDVFINSSGLQLNQALLFTNQGSTLKQRLSCFELRYSLLKTIMKYCETKTANLDNISGELKINMILIKHEHLVIEAFLDPYQLLNKLSNFEGDQSQTII